MATTTQVRRYVACWLQLGKRVIIRTPNMEKACVPIPVLSGARMSQEFELLWQDIQSHPHQFHLEGTTESIADLLSNHWELVSCAQCQLPVAMRTVGIHTPRECPCTDLTIWPNSDTLPPRLVEPEAIASRLNDLQYHWPDF